MPLNSILDSAITRRLARYLEMSDASSGFSDVVVKDGHITVHQHQSAYPCGQPPVGWFSGRVGLVYRRDVTRCLCCFKTPGGNAGRDIPTPESGPR